MSTDNETTELEEQLAEARAQIEQLQASAADAEARAATAGAEIKSAGEAHEQLRVQLTEATTAREEAQDAVTAMQTRLREAAAKYREARLASAPDVPHDLVPELETIEDIDREFESALRVVGQLREKIEREAVEQHRSARIPAGAPPRRQADVSSLSPGEKIRIGIQQRDERQAR